MTIVIGLTGSFGSGKTTVADCFKQLGAKVIDADQIARQVVQPQKPAYKEIVGKFGQEVLRGDGRINRKRLRQLVFSEPQKLKELNKIIHPRVREEELKLLKKYKSKSNLVVLNVPLLLENRLDRYVDYVVVVTVDDKIRYKRLKRQRGLNTDEIDRILSKQMAQEEKIKKAHFVINNNGSLANTKSQVRELMSKLMGQKSVKRKIIRTVRGEL